MSLFLLLKEKIKHGAVREDGYTFWGYTAQGYEQWNSPKAYRRARIRGALKNAKKRAAENSVPFDIDIDQLIEIYPADGLCPVRRTPMVWGNKDGLANSPSIDRRVPRNGYVRGNVMWISQRANTLKSDATVAEIEQVLNYMKAPI